MSRPRLAARPGRENRRKPYSSASTAQANTTTYRRAAGITTLPMRATPSATGGMDSGSGPKNIRARFCRIMASPIVAIMPFSSSRRNGCSTLHSSSAPPATAPTKVMATAAMNGRSSPAVRK